MVAVLPAVVVLDQRIGHVHAEAVAALAQPEAHDVDHGLPRLGGRGGVHAHLPGAFRVGESVVERGLAFEEVQHIGAVARGFAADERQAVGAGEPRIGPDVPVGVLVALRTAADAEPGVLLAGVAGDQVQQHVHAAAMGLVEQGDQVVVGAVARGDLEVVAHVVARVLEGRVEATGLIHSALQPRSPDVVELGDDAGDVADARRRSNRRSSAGRSRRIARRRATGGVGGCWASWILSVGRRRWGAGRGPRPSPGVPACAVSTP